MKPTISTTWSEIRKHTGREGVDFIAIPMLGKYGYTTEIVADMQRFDIFPQTYLVCGQYYVLRDEIFGEVTRKLLENSMTLYQGVQDAEATKQRVREAMEDVVLDQEATEKLASGEWTMDQVRERSQRILAERRAAEQTPQEAA